MNVLVLPTTVFYLLAAYVCITGLLNKRSGANKWLWLSAGCAMLLHGIWEFQHLFLAQGQDLSIFNVAGLVSLLITMTVTALAKPFKLWFVLPVVYLFAIVTMLLAVLIPSDYIIHLELKPQVLIHISVALAAFTVLMIASLYALQMAYLDWTLKRHKPGAIHPAMPSLMGIEKQLFTLIRVGLILLSISLLSGFVFLTDFFANGRGHKAIFSLIAWFIYSALLWGHHYRGWRGKSVVILTVIGSILLSLAYFGSRFVKEIILS
ncbi:MULTISPECIES: inner membrane protein YpjD [unclassified Agarivorans]|uniref:cytochrome C assembly family protein n=1 Tax=unclassified Agarivorans TaxID=2636026 RepID=UPI0010F5F979|nr:MULTISPECIES: cytochrome c biogenesis protein CcsA [unclassified Agarivorans]MDO6687675.1 cytochrome c biogenesis protein CcsA [Agarivorans sp. 3_MG-2023]MDO6717229.1 cytochrome c biogenesis protein CcsA [Agarivorans sp. 2_MG-2023]